MIYVIIIIVTIWLVINIILPIMLSKSNRASIDDPNRRRSSKMIEMENLDNYVDEWRSLLGEDLIAYKERNVK